MAIYACSTGVDLSALADLGYGRGELAFKANHHRRIDLQSQTEVCQQSL
jgi:hypothetical protein